MLDNPTLQYEDPAKTVSYLYLHSYTLNQFMYTTHPHTHTSCTPLTPLYPHLMQTTHPHIITSCTLLAPSYPHLTPPTPHPHPTHSHCGALTSCQQSDSPDITDPLLLSIPPVQALHSTQQADMGWFTVVLNLDRGP